MGSDRHVVRTTREAQGRVSADGIELAFAYWPGHGAPLVAIHGLTATYMTFIGVAECLAGRRPLWALDLRGRGDSDKPKSPYGMEQHARDVAAAMRAIGLGPSVILGHSMGGFVAAALANLEPSLVSGLVLIDGGYVPDAPAGAAPDQGMSAALALRIEQLRNEYPSRDAYRAHWRSQPHFPPANWNRWIEQFLDYEVAGDSPVRPKASEDAVRADIVDALRAEVLVNRMKALRVPTILIRAESGFVPGQPPLYPDHLQAQIQATVPQIELHKVSGASHYSIVLGETGAAKIADLACAMADRVSSDKRAT
jgi:lipase